jgi:hypothetical protein
MKSILESLQSPIPSPIIEIVGGYDCHHDVIIDELYNKIMNDLGVSSPSLTEEGKGEKIKLLNFYDHNFAAQLLELIKGKKEEFPPNHFLWDDLYRLMFKWTLAMRRHFANDDASFEKLAADTISAFSSVIEPQNDEITSTINTSSSSPLPLPSFDFSLFGHLIKVESLDNLMILRYFIKNVIGDLYDYNNRETLKMTCQQLKDKHFNGNFNNNPLLKLMLITFTPELVAEQIKKECMLSENLTLHRDYSFIIGILEAHSKNRIPGEGIQEVEYVNAEYISSATVEFFLNNNLGFLILDSNHLIRFLMQLDGLGLLQVKNTLPLNKIIKFRDFRKSTWEWNSNRYMTNLLIEKDNFYNISQYEYDRYAGLIN